MSTHLITKHVPHLIYKSLYKLIRNKPFIHSILIPTGEQFALQMPGNSLLFEPLVTQPIKHPMTE